jgi:hypothetical protein
MKAAAFIAAVNKGKPAEKAPPKNYGQILSVIRETKQRLAEIEKMIGGK